MSYHTEEEQNYLAFVEKFKDLKENSECIWHTCVGQL